jgi:nucleoside 2-deoxyribosyltransferase
MKENISNEKLNEQYCKADVSNSTFYEYGFWFETIKSVGAFRKVDKEEVYYIDKISDIVNKKLQSSEDFLRLVKTSVKKFNELEL